MGQAVGVEMTATLTNRPSAFRGGIASVETYTRTNWLLAAEGAFSASLNVPADDQTPFERERAAFLRKRPYLSQHAGEFVAIHNGEVEAADKSRNATLRKFFAKYPPGTSVYLGFVGTRPIARVPTPLAVRHRR